MRWVFMLAALTYLVCYAMGVGVRVEAHRWFFVLRIGRAMFYMRWMNARTAQAFRELREREGFER